MVIVRHDGKRARAAVVSARAGPACPVGGMVHQRRTAETLVAC
jgi:hypothetical protein